MFTPETLRALFLSSIAGLSTLLGVLIIFFTRRKNEKLLVASLGFAAGVMISVTFSDLIPQATNLFTTYVQASWGVAFCVLFLVCGLFFAYALDKFVPHQEYDEKTGGVPHKNLFRVGFVSMLAIGLHNFPEGIITFMAGYKDATLGLSIAVAIAMHNIPEGITVAMPVYFATGSRKKAFWYTFISGIVEPVGAFLAFLVLRPFISDFLLGILFALVSGIMLYVSLEELIPSSRQYGKDRYALISTFIGICTMLLTQMF